MLSAQEKNKLFGDIHNGKITERKLPENLYLDIAKDLSKAVFKGFDETIKIKNLVTEGPDFETLSELQRNIYVFSAAKTFQQVMDMQNFIFDDQGFIKPFGVFSKDVNQIYTQYNVEWQRTEFDTAVSQAQAAAQWRDIQKDKEDLPMLRYQTAGDERVRPIHASWDGITRPVDDGFWDDHTPPNGFNCRCVLIQLERGKSSPLSGVKENDDKLFAMNPGKDQLIFIEKGQRQHPYFSVSDKFKVLKSRNFDLPIPKFG